MSVMNPRPTIMPHPTLTRGQLDALERVYQSQLVSLILGYSDPIVAKSVLSKLTIQLRANHRDPASIIAGATKMAQRLLGLRR